MKIIGIITARGGSKGIPRKNIKLLGGKPLIAWTIEAAINASMLDAVIVSTDDWEIAEIAKKYGAIVPFIRPESIAKDDTPHIDVVLHALNDISIASANFTHCCLLQPTSPLRDSFDINECCKIAIRNKCKAVVSVTENRSYPFYAKNFMEDKILCPLIILDGYLPRQKIKPRYFINGAVYVNRIDHILKKKSFYSFFMRHHIMPEERAIQIDKPIDLNIAECLISRNNSSVTISRPDVVLQRNINL